MTFVISEKQSQHGLLIVITDAEILGKKFEQGKLQLDLTQDFYQGFEQDEGEVRKIIAKARHLHLTGEKIVSLGIELDVVNKERILWVAGVPHAEVFIED